MAEIPVKKEGGIPWWLLVAAVLIIALLLFWWLSGDDDDYAGNQLETEDVERVEMDDVGGTIVALSAIRTNGDLSDMNGRKVDIDGVRVTDVVGDRTFRIADNSGNDLFVVLDQVATPNQPGVEGRYDINPGQMIDIQGELRITQDGRIDGAEIEDMPADTQIYLWADEATIKERS